MIIKGCIYINILLLYGESIFVVLSWRRERPTQRNRAELLVRHISGKENVVTDALSKMISTPQSSDIINTILEGIDFEATAAA